MNTNVTEMTEYTRAEVARVLADGIIVVRTVD